MLLRNLSSLLEEEERMLILLAKETLRVVDLTMRGLINLRSATKLFFQLMAKVNADERYVERVENDDD
jgi:hypothetical protein